MRQKARAEGRPARYDRWRDRDPSEAPAGVAPAIRFRAPDQGETVIDDQVQGVVRFDVGQLDDMILLRGDGTPTYMLAVVADDHDMAVTHVIRGVDHLTNAARQAQLFMALGWEVPVFAHIPLIHGPDGAKLSKRHGALAAQAYRDQGFLPEAMRNYLARLGWSHGDDEIFLHRSDGRVVRPGSHRQIPRPFRHGQAAQPERHIHSTGERFAANENYARPTNRGNSPSFRQDNRVPTAKIKKTRDRNGISTSNCGDSTGFRQGN